MLIWILTAACLICAGAAWLTYRRAAALSASLRSVEADRAAALAAASRENHRLTAAQTALSLEYDTLLEYGGVGVLILDKAGVIQRANRTACQLFQGSASALIGKTLLQATLSDELFRLFKASIEQKTAQRRDLRVSAIGSRHLMVSITPLLEPEGAARFVLVAQDVTVLRRLETVRRDFVANVSHEMRTPLASIRAMAETLQDGALEDLSVASRFLGTIITEAQRLTRISEDLLALSDAESRLPEKGLFLLAPLIESVLARFQSQAEKASVCLGATVPESLVLFANRDQIEQVLVNLIDNAIKYTPQGGRVDITAEPTLAGVQVHVADTGIGILREHQPRLFERFYRVDKARSRQSGGTGLGLSIVKHIVESHGGSVTVESEYNRGSVFTFLLPAPAEAVDPTLPGV